MSYDPTKRTRRTGDRGKFSMADFSGTKQNGFIIDCEPVTHALIRAHRERVARKLEVIEDEAARLILTGCASELPKITIYGYAPLGADGEVAPGASVFFPGSGWTNAEGTAAFHTLTEQLPPRILDLDEISTHRIAGYAPSTGMKAYAVARDGAWVWPGCSQPAERCQLDHRVPLEDGGATTPANLFSLYQRHHNVKTDRRAY